MKRPVAVDTDIGTDIDDVVALTAVLGSPSLDLVGVTTVYVDAPLRARIARCLLDLAGAGHVAVWPGRSVPVRALGALAEEGVWEWHEGRGLLYDEVSAEERDYMAGNRPRLRPYVPDGQADGDGDGEADGPDRLAALADAHPGLSVVCIGPLTNLATALQRHAGFERSVGAVTVMGGCFRPDVDQPQFEHNFAADPGAAEVVFRSSLPLTVVGFDATETCHLVRDQVSPLCRTDAGTPFSDALNRLIDIYFDVKDRWRTSMHDPLAVAVAEDPAIGVIEETEVSLDPVSGNTSVAPFPGAIRRSVSLLRSVWPDRGEAFVYGRLRRACGGRGGDGAGGCHDD